MSNKKQKELWPDDRAKLEAARGLIRRGQLPTVAQYNEAVNNKKLIGKPINDYYLRK